MDRENDIANKAEPNQFGKSMSPEVAAGDSTTGRGTGPAGLTEFLKKFREAFPHLDLAVEHVIEDGEKAGISYTVAGTRHGTFHGVGIFKQLAQEPGATKASLAAAASG